jgi:hypothetical protein
MGPETGADPPGQAAEEDQAPPVEGHRVAIRRPDGPPLDAVLPPVPAEREHHGG